MATISCTSPTPTLAVHSSKATPHCHRRLPLLAVRRQYIYRQWPFRLRAAAVDDGGRSFITDDFVLIDEPDPSSELVELKEKLKTAINSSSQAKPEIAELVTQLEAKNPTPAPTQSPLLSGKWILKYTSLPIPIPESGPLRVDEISETIDADNFSLQNSLKIAGPLGSESVDVNSKLDFQSPKRVQIKFEEGVIETPQLTDSIDIPDKVELPVFGQNVDLTPFKGVISSIESAASSVARSVNGLPPLKIPIPSDRVQTWVLLTYLDEDLRIARGFGGFVFVFIREEGSPSLS